MNVLYAIQGTGNGHMARAREIIPQLDQFCSFDLLVSGDQYELPLAYPVKYHCSGLTLHYNSSGAIDMMKTFRKNKFSTFMKEARSLPVKDYDLVISDFEPTSAWAAKMRGVPSIALSHQAAFRSKNVPRPDSRSLLGESILKAFAPTGRNYGFHFVSYDENIFSPLIRKEVQELEPTEGDYYTVYLPAFSADFLIDFFGSFPEEKWQIFTRNVSGVTQVNNVRMQPIENEEFLKSLSNCKGVVCSAGFELPSEAMFLGKKLLVVPIKKQYEQLCNAEALKELGVPVLSQLTAAEKNFFADWLENGSIVQLAYHQNLTKIVRRIFEDHIAWDLERNAGLRWGVSLF